MLLLSIQANCLNNLQTAFLSNHHTKPPNKAPMRVHYYPHLKDVQVGPGLEIKIISDSMFLTKIFANVREEYAAAS